MEEHAPPAVVIVAALVALAVAVALAWGQVRPATDTPAPWAVAPVPTLQPTPPISVPTPAPVPTVAPVVYIEENNGSVTVNNVDVDVTVCILSRCP